MSVFSVAVSVVLLGSDLWKCAVPFGAAASNQSWKKPAGKCALSVISFSLLCHSATRRKQKLSGRFGGKVTTFSNVNRVFFYQI